MINVILLTLAETARFLLKYHEPVTRCR